jgi:Predicted hydrolases of the HAD superfamily
LFADVNIKGMSKSKGIDAMLKYYNIPLSQSMAFGDGGNDITMLRHAAIGVAMGDASDAVKQAADYVTDTVDDNGVVNALKYFNLL